ncbi:MAG: MATE family efflux transporter [Spirochaetales bacterium]|nr:MATE family efflux transporter [Spirochaetales bacterium]
MKASRLDIVTESKQEFLKRLLQLSIPIMLQNLLGSSVSFVDTLMIGRIGEEALAAVGLANQLFFLISLFFFGVSSGSAIFIAQYWGAQDIRSMHKMMGISLSMNLVGALFSSIVSLFFPEAVMHLFTKDPQVVQRGTEYLVYVGISYLFTAVVMTFSTALRSTGNTKTPLIVSSISLSINVVLNYILINGAFGFPRLEVVGAAIATTIARFTEMVILTMFVYVKRSPVAASLSTMMSFQKRMVASFFITCTPVILNELLWSLGMTAYKVAYARMGIDVIAAVNVTESIQGLFFVALMGIGNATAIMIGNRIGENKIELAKEYARRCIIIGALVGLVLGILLALTAQWLPLPFGLQDSLHSMTTAALVALGIVLAPKAINMVTIVGILRSGGDTRFSLFAEIGGVWFIGVPAAFIGGLVLHLPLYGVYLLVASEELFKLVVGLLRIKSGKWINRLTSETEAVA